MRDPYAVLGVGRRASMAEIKAAYRTLAKRWHPDRHRGDAEARARFVEISEAYRELGGNASRETSGKSARARSSERTASPGAARAGAETKQADTGDGGADDADMMERIFGVGPARTTVADAPGLDTIPEDEPAEPEARRGGRAHGRTVLLALNALFSRRRHAAAHTADDEPAAVAVTVPLATILSGGTVEAPAAPDGTAHAIEIAPGTVDGARIVLPRGTRSDGGRLEVIVRHAFSDAWWSAGADLHATLAIDLETAVLGGRRTFATLDGSIRLTVPAWSGSDRTLRVAGRGLPKADGVRGDLFVHLRVLLPETPDEMICDLLKARKEGFYV